MALSSFSGIKDGIVVVVGGGTIRLGYRDDPARHDGGRSFHPFSTLLLRVVYYDLLGLSRIFSLYLDGFLFLHQSYDV
jgi:hypothetical protein